MPSLLITLFYALFAILVWTSDASATDNKYLQVSGPCHLQFPKDHGSHPGYRTEWWYYTGHLTTENHRRFGYQLTFFRSQLRPNFVDDNHRLPKSDWRSNQIYLAHAAISDLGGKRHLYVEELSRAALQLAGVNQKNMLTEIYLKNWHTRIGPATHQLVMQNSKFSFELNLSPEKLPVLHGQYGYSRKGASAESASCYYSFTRLKTEGTLRIGRNRHHVKGQSWMDHEFSSAPLEPNLVGWDWFGLQLSDRTEIMIYLLRTRHGKISPASSGTYVRNTVSSRHLDRNDFNITILKYWQSAKSKASYPAGWMMRIPSLGVKLKISPNIADQEMITTMSTGVTYWEGSVDVDGTVKGKPVQGQGYVELTGYDQPFNAPM